MRNWVVIGLLLFFIGLIGSGITFASKGDFSFGTEKVERHQSITADGIRNIEIKAGSTDLIIVPVAGSEVRASLTGRASKKYLNQLALKLERDGDTLRVGLKEHTGFSFGLNIMNVDLKLEVPQRQYDLLKLDSGSGGYEVNELQVEAFQLDGGYGNVKLNQLQAKTIAATIGSGNMTFADVTATGEVTVKTGSGNVHVKRLRAGTLNVRVSSGNVDLADADAELKVDTGSGNITVAQQRISLPAALKTGSGNVAYRTDEQPANADFSYSSGSGNLDNDWKGGKGSTDDDGLYHLVFGSGAIPLQIHTGSGDLDIGKR